LVNIKHVFFTDSNDVKITKNPFLHPNISSAFLVGRDNANRIKDSGWLKLECDKYIQEIKCSIPKTYTYQWVYNAGVCGGSRNLMFFVTNEMSKLIFKTTSNFHKDMTLLNLVIHTHFFPILSSRNWDQTTVEPLNDDLSSHKYLISGYPLNSAFKTYDNNSKAYFIHK
jgi:hypothetical protein